MSEQRIKLLSKADKQLFGAWQQIRDVRIALVGNGKYVCAIAVGTAMYALDEAREAVNLERRAEIESSE